MHLAPDRCRDGAWFDDDHLDAAGRKLTTLRLVNRFNCMLSRRGVGAEQQSRLTPTDGPDVQDAPGGLAKQRRRDRSQSRPQ